MKSLIERELNKKLGTGTFTTPKILDKPISIGGNAVADFKNHVGLIHTFFSTVSIIAQAALAERDNKLIELLFSEPCCGLNIEYHKALPDNCWSIPLFFRTDQSISGKIYEIQSPGSGWGDLYLFAKCYKEMGHSVDEDYLQFPYRYSKIVSNATGQNHPKVFHILDAASVPHSMRYLLSITSDYIDYWGLNCNVTMDDVDFVTAHSVCSLASSNYFKSYLKKMPLARLFLELPQILFLTRKLYMPCRFID